MEADDLREAALYFDDEMASVLRNAAAALEENASLRRELETKRATIKLWEQRHATLREALSLESVAGDWDQTLRFLADGTASLRRELEEARAKSDTWKGRALTWAPTAKIREWEAIEGVERDAAREAEGGRMLTRNDGASIRRGARRNEKRR